MTWLPWPVERPATPDDAPADPLEDPSPLEEPSTLAPQTQSQQAAPPRRSGSGGGMFKFLVPRGEGEIGTRTFG